MNEHSIFLAALEIVDANQRAAYLDQACADDPSLRKQVDALFAAHERSGEFLDVPALKQMAAGQPGEATSAEDDAGQGEIDLSFLEPSTAPGSLGRLGHYEVREVIGRGGCGIVLKAFDEKLERIVAIKIMAPELAATSPARKRFLREARATAAIRHENVVSIYAVEEQPLPFLVMEYIDGETLQDRLNRTGPLDEREVLRIGRQIASGLGAAHAKGLIHRDVKPGNILLEGEPGSSEAGVHVKITDFGLARSADDASITQSGVISGTPLYMSPEQAQAQDIDHRSDLFSLGSVLYVMCSGRPPFRAATTFAVLKRVVEVQPRPIQGIIPEVPKWLVAIIAKLHAKNPDERFASAQEVGDVLRGEQPPSEDKDVAGPVTPPTRWRRSNWVAVAAMIMVLLAGLGITEATGVTNVGGTVIRLFSPEGTLVVEVDDPGVSVTIDGEELVITGAGAKEIRLKPGQYKLMASKDGKVVRQELVTVTKNGRKVVRVSREGQPTPPTAMDRRPKFRSGGDWIIEDGELVQATPGFARLLFGDAEWTDYDFEVEAKSMGKNKDQGIGLLFRASDLGNNHQIDIGGWGATVTEAIFLKKGKWGRSPGCFLKIPHEHGRWYKVKIEVRGPSIHCLVDGKSLFMFNDETFLKGMIGLGTHSAPVRWRNLKVTAPDGKVVWEGFPKLPSAEVELEADKVVSPSPNEQAEKVRDELRRRNPDFKGAITYFVEDGQVVRWSIVDGTLADLTPLLGLEHLKELNYAAFEPERDAPVVARLTSLEKINEDSRVVSYRLAFPANKPPPGVSDEWLKAVSKLPVQSRVKVVMEKLQEQNPNFDGKYSFGKEGTSMRFDSRAVTDLSPLAALPELTQLSCSVPFANNPSWLADLSPLSGMSLTYLQCYNTRVTDLKPLAKMPLNTLLLSTTRISDLTPLKRMPLVRLDIGYTQVEDLGPVADAKLQILNCVNTKIVDFSPLKGMPLVDLRCGRTPISD